MNKMNNALHDYLQKLSGSGVGLEFFSTVYQFGEFSMYCLLGPQKNIIHLTFAPEKHVIAQKQLSALDSRVCFTHMNQEESLLYSVFRDYFRGRLFLFPVEIRSPFFEGGTDFQKRVWRHLRTIPYGKCITYHELAALSGSPNGARAAGIACGANPLSLIIPCHRVVAVNGLGGFAGGTAVKEALLDLEKLNSDNLSQKEACLT